jgi:hypothetical protein
MVFAFENPYSLKCWSLLTVLRTRAIQWAHATGVLSLEAETPLRSIKTNVLREGCPSFVPTLPGRFFLKFESAETQAAYCLPSNDNAGPNDHRLPRVCAVIRDSAAPLPTQAANREGRTMLAAQKHSVIQIDPTLASATQAHSRTPPGRALDTHGVRINGVSVERVRLRRGLAREKHARLTPDEVSNECSN